MTSQAEAITLHPATDIDWPLLLLLARTEAALTWPDMAVSGEPDDSLPPGLDLRHHGDFEWVSQVVDRASRFAPSPTLERAFS